MGSHMVLHGLIYDMVLDMWPLCQALFYINRRSGETSAYFLIM
jgi:hypothetical protein